MAIGEEAEMTDAVEPVRNHVLKEPPYELVGRECHELAFAATT